MSEVHLRHFYDGYPLCWPMDREGDHESTSTEREVTCVECLKFMKESWRRIT